MKLLTFQAKNFRNLKRVEHQPSAGLNILVGENAQGKTNLLEAIYVLATGNSFRTHNDRHLINDQAESYELRSTYELEGRCFENSVAYSAATGKMMTFNGRKSHQNHPDRLRVVLFTPDDLYLVKGSPSRRRFFLDFLLKQTGGEYGYYLDNYVKILKKRNYLFKNNQANSRAWEITTELFIEHAARVILSRIQMVQRLDELAAPFYQNISGEQGSGLKIRYALSFPVENGKINLDILKLSLFNHLKQVQEQERLRRSSLTGPHLDDLNLYLNDHVARQFASQGQQRNIVVSLKMAEIMAICQAKGEYPIFLLDEVLSELDNERQNRLISYLEGASFQSFLTTVNLENYRFNQYKASISRISSGQLLRKE